MKLSAPIIKIRRLASYLLLVMGCRLLLVISMFQTVVFTWSVIAASLIQVSVYYKLYVLGESG